MTMAIKGVAKLIEELGELQQILGKKLAYWDTDEHPDGQGSISERIMDEMGDVTAAMNFVAEQLGLIQGKIRARHLTKYRQFREWNAKADNNQHAVVEPSPLIVAKVGDQVLFDKAVDTLGGLKIVVDEAVPEGEFRFVDDDGSVVGVFRAPTDEEQENPPIGAVGVADENGMHVAAVLDHVDEHGPEAYARRVLGPDHPDHLRDLDEQTEPEERDDDVPSHPGS